MGSRPLLEKVQLWFTAQEFAEAAEAKILLDIPKTERGINDLAKRENWQRYHALVKAEKARGRNGTLTRYHVDLLPLHVRIGYFTRFINVDAGDCGRSMPSGENLTDRARLERDARLAVIRIVDRFRRLSGMNAKTADGLFAEIYNSGRLDVPAWVRDVIGSLSSRSLLRWRGKERDAGCDELAHDPALARKGSGLLETANSGLVKNFILASIANNPALSATHVRGHVEDEFGAELVDRSGELKPLPPIRTFQHFLAALKLTEKVALTKINNPDKFRSTMALRGTGSYSWVKHPNQLWMIDASPGDALLIGGRHSIYVCIDVATRRLVITVSKTPKASAVGLMMCKAIIKLGKPEAVKMDNGSDFVAEETKRLLSSVAIETELSQKYTPEEKAFVERSIKTIQHDFFVQLPGYIGHNVAERKAIEERKGFAHRLGETDTVLFGASVTAEQLQLQLDDWLEHVYHARVHGGLAGLSPNQATAASSEPIIRIDERALDALLMPVAGKNGLRRMTAQGISIGDDYYLTGAILVGTDVFVRCDPEDLGKVYVYSADDGRFLDVAICPKKSGVNPAAYVKAQKELSNAIVSERVKAINTDVRKLLKGPSGIERTIRLAKQKTAERNSASTNVIQLPRREEQHTTCSAQNRMARRARSVGTKKRPQDRPRHFNAYLSPVDSHVLASGGYSCSDIWLTLTEFASTRK